MLTAIYTALLISATGLTFVLVSLIVCAPATVLFVMARGEQGRPPFSPSGLLLLAVSPAGALFGIVALAAGRTSLGPRTSR